MITTTSVAGFLIEHGLFEPDVLLSVEPLTGGVSSDICLVTDGQRSVVVKTPLASLKVADDWQAPVARSTSEAAWLRVVAALAPGACPQVLAYDEEQHLLALSYLDPRTHILWKDELLAGRVDPGFAAMVGDRIGFIHRSTSTRPDLAATFANDDLFRALRIAPYFESAVERNADLRVPMDELIAVTMSAALAVGHGDVSPKNILIGPEGPVLLDAETAWWGDPAFDVAFCLNHLLLKCLLPEAPVEQLVESSAVLLAAYLQHVDWESPAGLERRVVRLLPALMLARVDGRSPVEYLTEPDRVVVRAFARRWILGPPADVAELTGAWKEAVR